MEKILFLAGLLFLTSCATSSSVDDQYLWLESIESKEALSWVSAESLKSKQLFEKDKGFEKRRSRILKVLESKDKVLYVRKRGRFVYNFWKDKQNPRGLWRRVSYKAYTRGWKLNWETLLDIDALSKKENKKWVFKGAVALPLHEDMVILKLSDGGKDAVHLREFSLKKKKFKTNGIVFPEARYGVAVLSDDQMLISSDSNTQMNTRSGYPREIKLYQRGQTLNEAKVLLTVPENHTGVWIYSMEKPGGEQFTIVEDSIDFFSSNKYIYKNGEIIKIPIPVASSVEGSFQNKIIFSLKKDVKTGAAKFNKGDLVYLDVQENNFSEVKLLLRPTESESIKSFSSTKNHMVVVIQENVSRKAYSLKFNKASGAVKTRLSLKGEVSVIDADPNSNKVILQNYDFLKPASVVVYDLESKKSKTVQRTKSFFSGNKYTYAQKWAVSEDGTKVPYYMVHKKDLKLNGANPTIMYGYGGFEVSLSPFYLKNRINEWVARGGVFVLSNIRGGGEFGPSWHQAAQKFNKKKSYEDFAAIAKALHSDKVTSPKHLGIVGGSNGGLLVGASSVLYPELYGAVFCVVPLLDMLRYDQLLVGASWIPEYGDPKIKKERNYLKTYSPYQNVYEGKKYPKIFFYTSTYDDRVHPAHARKMYKKMKDQGHEVYYYENSEGGHAGASDLKQRSLSEAMKFTFFWKTLK